ncbi:MAG: ABC transporter substrate-binding protein [Beijerinckiaceae bacterium]|nr:ABC transporter substrate-binding protein [Beijerinckiaceae bacterium]
MRKVQARTCVRAWTAASLFALCVSLRGGSAVAETAVQASQLDAGKVIHILYLAGDDPKASFLSLLQNQPDDEGEAGASLALDEVNLTGRFIGLHYTLDVVHLHGHSDLAAQTRPLLSTSKLIVAALTAPDLLTIASMPEAVDAVILDIGSSDDRLRQEQCRRNVFHLLPSIAMRSDALAQYLMKKRWARWLVLRGPSAEDQAWADDLHRSAARFGGKIVEDRLYSYDAGSRRVDTGYQQIQTQLPLATANAPSHDIVIVADTADFFGDYLPYNTTEPRPVAGTQGLVPVAWHPAFQEYSALQMQHRFELAAHRTMNERDYAGWLAIRAIGEASIRSGKTETADLGAFMRSKAFELAGFKGQAMTFRPWDQQLRQPVLLASALMVVSLSPQEGYLHPKFLTDTLGFDEPETKCHLTP